VGATPPFCLKKGTPLTFSSDALLSKKITKNIRKRAKLQKTPKVGKKPKIGPRGSFERFLSVFRPYKYKKGSTDTIFYHFHHLFSLPGQKMGTPILSPRISRISLPFPPPPKKITLPCPPTVNYVQQHAAAGKSRAAMGQKVDTIDRFRVDRCTK
jgi:hypothetical protein